MSTKMKHKDVIKLVKRNEAQEFVNVSREYLKKHLENVIIWVVVCVVLVVGVTMFINGKSAKEIKASEGVSEAAYYMTRPVVDNDRAGMYGFFRTEKEKYEKAQDTYMSVLKDYKGTKAEPVAYLGVGGTYFLSGQYKEAEEYYGDFVKKFPSNQLVSEALNGKAYALFQQGLYQDAQKIWEEVSTKYEGGMNPSDVQLKLADCYIKLGNKPAAKQIYEDILKDKSESYWTSVAKDMLSGIN